MGPGHHMTSSIDQQQVYYDPVCGNHIDSISKDLSWRYKEEIYYFHSNECMSKFMENPINYVTINDQRAKNYFLWGLGSIGMTAMMILMIF
jgi:YHS domain-containing protein